MITYRKTNLADIFAITQLFNEILDTSFPEYPPAAVTAFSKAWTEDALTKRLLANNDLLISAWQDDLPIGFVSGPPPEGGVGTVVWLLVKEEMRGAKIGSTLFKMACEYYKSVDGHKVKLTASNQKARDFYHKIGMTEEGFHSKHWWGADFWSFGIQI